MASPIKFDDPCPCGSGDVYGACCGRQQVVKFRQRRNWLIAAAVAAALLVPSVQYMNRLDEEKFEAITLPEGAYYSEEHKHWHDAFDQELRIPGWYWHDARQKWVKVNETLIEKAKQKKAFEESLQPDGQPIEDQFSHIPEAQSGVPAPSTPAPEGQVWSEEHGHYHPAEQE